MLILLSSLVFARSYVENVRIAINQGRWNFILFVEQVAAKKILTQFRENFIDGILFYKFAYGLIIIKSYIIHDMKRCLYYIDSRAPLNSKDRAQRQYH